MPKNYNLAGNSTITNKLKTDAFANFSSGHQLQTWLRVIASVVY